MSVTQTYYLAHTARAKLSAEAARADHDLRLLVGHANMLDSLMLHLAEAERDQESWFNHSVRGAAQEEEKEEEKHIRWADTIVEEPEQDWDVADADAESDSDDSDSDFEIEDVIPYTPARATYVATIAVTEEDDEEYEDDEDDEDLALTRTPSHSPPQLVHDSHSDSDSDDDMPPSPPQITLPVFSEKQRKQIATTSLYSADSESSHALSEKEQESFFEEGFYLPSRSEISAY